MSDIKLSVVVLVYNTEQYLRECLDSLVNQTLDGIEIITVNDESPDDSALILEEYAKKYPNIKVIHQKNSGGAVAGNNGVMHARGEYITLMDSDDVVPLDAYEKLYKKAKEVDADIVIGKAKLLVDGKIKDVVYDKERKVWDKERVIDNLLEYPDVFYDGFYWNKIYRREFILEHNALMPPGMLYADRPMVHKAFLYAKRIAIITDLVYYWRKRGTEASQKSITQLKNDLRNFKDRIESLYYQIDYINDFGNEEIKNEFLKRNVERLLFPINGVLDSIEFREAFLTETKKIYEQITDIYDNDLGIIKNLYIYFILNDMTDELLYYLRKNPNGPIIEEGDNYYWALPYFRDPNHPIPDERFLIERLLDRFIHIDKINLDKSHLVISNVSIPKKFHVKDMKLIIVSRLDSDVKWEIPGTLTNEGTASFEVNLSNYNLEDIYDLYIYLAYDKREDEYRISAKMLDSKKQLKSNNPMLTVFFTKNDLLSLVNSKMSIDTISFSNEHLSIKVSDDFIGKPVELLLRDRVNKDRIYFEQVDEAHFILKWKHFLDPNRTYDLYYRVYKRLFRLGIDQVHELKEGMAEIQNIQIRLYKTSNDNISLETFAGIRKQIRSFRGLLKMGRK